MNLHLPQPTNLQAKRMLQKALNRIALAPIRTAQYAKECVFCGQPINQGEEYRDGGYAHRAHKACLTELSARLRGECVCGLQLTDPNEEVRGHHHPECPKWDGHN